MAAAAAPVVGARAVFLGVDQFVQALGALGTQFGNLAAAGGTLSNLNQNLGAASTGFNRFNAVIDDTGRAVGAMTTAVSTVTAPVRTIGSAVTSAAGEVVEGSSKIVGAFGDIAIAGVELSEKGVLGVGAVGTAVVGLAATAVTEAAKYQRGMKDIEAVSQVTGTGLDALDVAIRRVGVNFPSSVGNIQRSALELSKAGVPIKDISTSILDLTTATEQLSSGELSAEQTAEAIGSNLKLFARSFEQSGDSVERQAARIVSSIQGIANATRASSSEVISAVTKLGPNLAVLGGSVEQTAALAGLVVAQGPRGQEAGTALANLFQRLEKPSDQADKILQRRPQLNLFTAEGLPRPAIDVIKSFQDTYGAVLKTNQAIDGLTPAMATAELAELVQTRSLRTLNLVLGLSTDDYRDMLAEIRKTDVIAQAATQNEALIRQLDILRNNAVLAGVAFGHDFVEGLGGGVKALNDFLREGDRAQAIGGVVGRGTASILTGTGQDQARAAVSDSPFGEAGVQTFDALESGSEKIRGNIIALAGDAANLGKTIGLIAFPEGLPGAISTTGDAIAGLISIADQVVKKFNELAPEVVADLQKITGASSFEELITDAQNLGKEIGKIFTDNGGEQSFKNLADAGVGTLTTIRKEVAPTLLELAKLGRTLEDTAPTFLRVADTAITAFGAMGRSIAEVTRLLTLLAAFDTDKIGGFFSAIGATAQGIASGFTRAGRNISGDFTISTAAQREDRARSQETLNAQRDEESVIAGRQQGRDNREAVVPNSISALAAIPSDLRAAGSQLDSYNQLLAQNAAATDTAAAATTNLDDVIGGTTGAHNNTTQAEKDAAAAQKALDEATKSLSAEMRTLDKDVSDAGGSFDKTIAGARQRWLDGLDQITESTTDAMDRIRRTASEGRTKTLETFNIQTGRSGGAFVTLGADGQAEIDLERGIVLGANTIFRQGQEDRKRIAQQGLEDVVNFRHQEQENETTSVGRHNEDISRQEQQSQEQILQIRQRGSEDRELLRQREQDRDLLAFQRGQERELTSFQRGQESQNTARLRAREDQRASQTLGTALSAATTPEERTRLLTSFTEDRRRTAQQRADQDQDTQFAKQQQDQLTQFRQTQEDNLTKKRQGLEDQNITHRRELEVADINFRRLLEVDLIDFRRNLEDRETNRRRVVASLEVAQRRQEELQVLGFSRGQEQEAQLFQLTNERIPDLQRQLAQLNQQETDQLQNTAESAARSLLRLGLTHDREVQAAGTTELEQLRRLQERFENESQSLLARVPESRRGELQAEIDGKRQVLAAQIAIAQAQQQGRAAGAGSDVNQITQNALDQLGAFSPNLGSIQSVFGQQATANLVTTSLLAAPQVDRLTTALENLTNKIDKVQPGIQIGTLEQNIEQPTTPQGAVVDLTKTLAGAI